MSPHHTAIREAMEEDDEVARLLARMLVGDIV